MSRYAPARDDGSKAWHVTVTEFRRKRELIVWAESARVAEREAIGDRPSYSYAKARRATPGDVERLGVA